MSTTAEPTLLQRAQALLGGAAAAALSLSPLAAQALDTTDLVVQGSGVYFYNASGYFADWQGLPDGQTVTEVNADGSAKFYGSATASPEQFTAHNCSQDRGCSWYQDRGVAMAWWGTLRAPAKVGDQLELRYDLSLTMPDVGGSWTLAASLSAWDFYNSVPQRQIDSEWLDAGTHQMNGVLRSTALESWDVSPDNPVIYWQVVLAGVAHAPWNETYWSDFYGSYVTPFRSVSLNVPNQSIDVALVSAPVPEPASALLWLAGLAGLAGARKWRQQAPRQA